jgi:choline dehydrogenase-like flavoprotein
VSLHKTKIAVVGSGPGGAIVGCLLAEAGMDVLIIEEGPYLELESCTPFTKDEMVQKYRNGGLTAALGNPKVQYVEGKCVGGGSEINSGLYHRTPEEVLRKWQFEFNVNDIDASDLTPYFEMCERDVTVSYLPEPAPQASKILSIGSAKLGWKALEIPRWFKYTSGTDGKITGTRQSMTKTYIPRAIQSGAKIKDKTKVLKLKQLGKKWVLDCITENAKNTIEAEFVFLCAGAIQTPALLRRSGIKDNIGNTLQLHPTAKVIAHFPEKINDKNLGVPVHQVKEFAPKISMGCSISSFPHLSIAKDWTEEEFNFVSANWKQMAIYYSMIVPEGMGKIRPLPGFRDPLVTYKLTPSDLKYLTEGLVKLCRLLLEAGATKLFPAINNLHPITSESQLMQIHGSIERKLFNLMTIHLFGSCPMGENKKKCATNSYGLVNGFNNLYISDASLLCSAPGVNPQGSIMAFAARNARNFIENNK